ncbi:MAG: S1/P1 nuclease [Verrucomicrobiota bacterium]
MKTIFAALLLLTGTCRAWGPEGHEIVGRIAEKNLTPAALHHLNELLNGTNAVTVCISDTHIANWPDEIRHDRPETAPWHYVDIAFDAEKFDRDHDCLAHTGCVVSAIEQFTQVLADKQTNTAARLEALKFLVHFVGDIHMPLHCAQRHDDHGGNMVWVRWPGEPKAAKLHGIWDVNFVQTNLHESGLAPLPYADQLSGKITPEQSATWSTGTPADWAWESHRIAVTKVYAGIPAYGSAFVIPAEYIKANQPVVAEQLTKAGLRLARLLNEALR